MAKKKKRVIQTARPLNEYSSYSVEDLVREEITEDNLENLFKEFKRRVENEDKVKKLSQRETALMDVLSYKLRFAEINFDDLLKALEFHYDYIVASMRKENTPLFFSNGGVSFTLSNALVFMEFEVRVNDYKIVVKDDKLQFPIMIFSKENGLELKEPSRIYDCFVEVIDEINENLTDFYFDDIFDGIEEELGL